MVIGYNPLIMEATNENAEKTFTAENAENAECDGTQPTLRTAPPIFLGVELTPQIEWRIGRSVPPKNSAFSAFSAVKVFSAFSAVAFSALSLDR